MQFWEGECNCCECLVRPIRSGLDIEPDGMKVREEPPERKYIVIIEKDTVVHSSVI